MTPVMIRNLVMIFHQRKHCNMAGFDEFCAGQLKTMTQKDCTELSEKANNRAKRRMSNVGIAAYCDDIARKMELQLADIPNAWQQLGAKRNRMDEWETSLRMIQELHPHAIEALKEVAGRQIRAYHTIPHELHNLLLRHMDARTRHTFAQASKEWRATMMAAHNAGIIEMFPSGLLPFAMLIVSIMHPPVGADTRNATFFQNIGAIVKAIEDFWFSDRIHDFPITHSQSKKLDVCLITQAVPKRWIDLCVNNSTRMCWFKSPDIAYFDETTEQTRLQEIMGGLIPAPHHFSD
jgi:hypothetical protein